MAYDSLKALIRQYIKTNGEQEITGQILQNVLVEMVNQYPSTDGFATQSWVTSQLAGYLPLTGGTLTGNLTLNSGGLTYFTIYGSSADGYANMSVDADGLYINAETTAARTVYLHPDVQVGHTLEVNYNLYVDNNASIVNECRAASFIKSGGTSAQFLKADGSVDSNTYVTSSALSGYLPLTGGTITGNLTLNSGGLTYFTIYGSSADGYANMSVDADGLYINAETTTARTVYLNPDVQVGHNLEVNYNLYVDNNASIVHECRAASFVKSGGTSAQFLKADGSVDSTAYITLASVKGNLSAWNNTAMTWGTLTAANGYTIGVHASSSDGGDWGMAYKGGQIFMQLDGYYYQNEGAYRVVDTSDLASYNPTTNFKTINNQSIIGTGNINIEGGGTLYDAEVEYLESTDGGQYIDTGWFASYSDGFVIETEYEFSSNGNRGCLLSNYDSGQTSLSLETTTGPRFYFYQGRLDYTYTVSAGEKHKTIFSYVNNVYSLTVDGVIRHSVTASYTGGSNYSAYMFLDREMRTDTFNKNLKIYRLKIKSGNNVVRDFIPVRIGNVGYMYDKVSGQLFGNSGTGSFVLGPDKEYLPLTGGTITGHLTVNGIISTRKGDLVVWSPQNYSFLPKCTFVIENIEWARLEMDTSAAFHFKHGSSADNTYCPIYAASFNQGSDLRKKTIMGDVPMNIYNVANAPLFKFTWKDETKYSGQHIGSAAQYWQTVLPELVSIGRDADMTLAMQYDVIALASAITVAKTVVNHEERIILLERENEALKKEIADLKSA